MTVLLIIVFILFGFAHSRPQPITFLPHAADVNMPLMSAFGASLIWVMYSYSGWNAASYIVEEVRNPAKALPRALIYGTMFVTVLYVAVNAVFVYTTPLDLLKGKLEVAHVAGQQIFGATGSRIASGLICVGLIANVSGMMWVGSRVTEAIGATYPVLGLLGRTSQTRVPFIALLFQFGIVISLLFFKPDDIVTSIGAVLLFWSFLAVIGVIVLRFREPNLPRPYRTWGYPVTPLIFAAITVSSLVQNLRFHPVETLVGAATVLIGIPIYLWASRNVSFEQQQLRGASLPGSSV
jgi:APA family basic amino acid/polyamine antiporter